MWWRPTWNECKVDGDGRLIGYLELKLLSCFNTLGTGANHFSVNIQTIFLSNGLVWHWQVWKSCLFTCLSHQDIQLKFVTKRWSVRMHCQRSIRMCPFHMGHVPWCATHYMYERVRKDTLQFLMKWFAHPEGSFRWFQLVFAHTSSAPNDKHIEQTGGSVMSLLGGNTWLNLKSWETKGCNGWTKENKGLYLFVMVLQLLAVHDVPSQIIKSRKHILEYGRDHRIRQEGHWMHFQNTPKEIHYLKNTFSRMRKQKDMDHAFTTWCIIINIILEVNE